MGNSGYSAGRGRPCTTARGEGWVSKMDADTREGDTNVKCCDRTDGGGVPKWCIFWMLSLQGARDPITERQRMIGVCKFLPKQKGNEGSIRRLGCRPGSSVSNDKNLLFIHRSVDQIRRMVLEVNPRTGPRTGPQDAIVTTRFF